MVGSAIPASLNSRRPGQTARPGGDRAHESHRRLVLHRLSREGSTTTDSPRSGSARASTTPSLRPCSATARCTNFRPLRCTRRPALDLLRNRHGAGGKRRGLLDLSGQSGTPRPIRRPRGPGRLPVGGEGSGPGRDPSLFDRRSMTDWAHHVTVPVFLSGALQDEQTGPQWPALINAFPKSTPVFANMVNGDHIDSADPQTIISMAGVPRSLRRGRGADQTRNDCRPRPRRIRGAGACGLLRDCAPQLCALQRHRTPRRQGRLRQAHAPRVRVLFDNGAGEDGPGTIGATYTANFSSWPPAGRITTLYLGGSGGLVRQHPTSGHTTFSLDPSVRPRTSLPAAANAWLADPGWDWTPVPSADGIGFATAPFTKATTIVGPATLDLWVKAGAPVEDFQATITEVRPQAAQEEYVTSGFLRSTNQVDLPNSTALSRRLPIFQGCQTLVGQEVRAREDPHRSRRAHLQARNKLRVVISAPGGDRPVWTFATLDHGQPATVGLGGVASSALHVNVVHGVDATTTVPACEALRGEPCRPWSRRPTSPRPRDAGPTVTEHIGSTTVSPTKERGCGSWRRLPIPVELAAQ